MILENCEDACECHRSLFALVDFDLKNIAILSKECEILTSRESWKTDESIFGGISGLIGWGGESIGKSERKVVLGLRIERI